MVFSCSSSIESRSEQQQANTQQGAQHGCRLHAQSRYKQTTAVHEVRHIQYTTVTCNVTCVGAEGRTLHFASAPATNTTAKWRFIYVKGCYMASMGSHPCPVAAGRSPRISFEVGLSYGPRSALGFKQVWLRGSNHCEDHD